MAVRGVLVSTFYEFFNGSTFNDNPISLTRDNKTCDMLLFDNMDGKSTFLELGQRQLLRGDALQAYKMMVGKNDTAAN